MPLDDPKIRNEETYDQLISLIENTQGRLAPIVVACDDSALRQRIVLRYESEARQAKIRPYRLVLGQEPSLRAGLDALMQQEDYLRQGGDAVFTVTGAELLLRVKLNPQQEQSELEKFFGYLQWTREGLQAFRYPIVLWVTQRLFQDMRFRAPDFWSWRKAELRFADESPHAPRLPIVAEPLSQRPTDAETESLPPLGELQAEIATLTDRDPDSPNLATLYDRLGQVYAQRIRQGNTQNLEEEREQAIAAFQQAIDRYHAHDKPINEMLAHINLGNFFDEQSRYQEAIACHQKALDIAKTPTIREALPQESRAGEAGSLGNLGNAYNSLGQYQQAIDFYQQSLEIHRTIGHHQGEASSLNGLGNSYESLGQYQRAIDFHQQSLKIKREIGNRQGEANSLGGLGSAYRLLGQYQRAIDFYQQALEIKREIGDRPSEASLLINLGNAYFSLRQYHQAIDFYQQSLEIQREIGDRQGEANSLNNLGSAYESLGQSQRVIDFCQQSLEIQREIGDRQGEANSLHNLGNAYFWLGQYHRAIDFHQQSLEIRREIGVRYGEAQSLFNLAGILAKLDRGWDAIQYYQQAQQIYQSLGLEHMVEDCATAIYQLNQIIPAQRVHRAPKINPAVNSEVRRTPEISSSVKPAPVRRRRKLSGRSLVFYGLVGLVIGLLVWLLLRG